MDVLIETVGRFKFLVKDAPSMHQALSVYRDTWKGDISRVDVVIERSIVRDAYLHNQIPALEPIIQGWFDVLDRASDAIIIKEGTKPLLLEN